MNFPHMTLACLLMLAVAAGELQAQDANNDDRNNVPPMTDYDPDSTSRLQEGDFELPRYTDDEEEDQEYKFPQAHEFEQPVTVGSDQLRLYRGYWQPGGYQVRDGSPFFNSVPGAPPRGPIAGGGGDSAYNPMEAGGAAANQNAYNQPGYNQNAFAQGYGNAQYGAAANNAYSGNGYSGYSGAYGYDPYGAASGYFSEGVLGGGMIGGGAAGGGAGGAGGDPYNYHFGPGYYRSSEYGHFRFPYYSYRRPWYHPGFAGFNRDVNIPW